MAKKKDKVMFPCKQSPDCNKTFATMKGLHIHMSQKDHWREKKNHTNYDELVIGKHWGFEMSREDKKHPSVESLKLGILFHIRDLLVDIKNKLNEQKK